MKAITLFWLLYSLLSLFGLRVLAAPTPDDKKVILYIASFDPAKDYDQGSLDLLFEDFRNEMAKRFPKSPIRKILPKSNAELKKALDTILKDGEKVHRLYINTHGSSESDKKLATATLYFGDDFIDFDYPKGDSERNSPKAIQEVNSKSIDIFSGIRGKFTDESHVILASCALLKQDSETEESDRIGRGIAIQTVLGQEKGKLYANSVEGFGGFNGEIIKQPFFKQTTWKGKLFFLPWKNILCIAPPIAVAATLQTASGFIATSIAALAFKQYVEFLEKRYRPGNQGYQFDSRRSGETSVSPASYLQSKAEFCTPSSSSPESISDQAIKKVVPPAELHPASSLVSAGTLGVSAAIAK